MEYSESKPDLNKFTKTISELSNQSGVPTSQIHYYIKKYSSDLEEHIYKKPGSTNPYLFDDEGFSFMLPILKQIAEKKAEADEAAKKNEIKSDRELYEERIEDLKSYYEDLLRSERQKFNEIVQLKDAQLQREYANSEILSKALAQQQQALDQQQKLLLLDKTQAHETDSPDKKNPEEKKHGLFSIFTKK